MVVKMRQKRVEEECMLQKEIEYFAFLYLCGEQDRKLLTKETAMTQEDFERFSYLTYQFGLMNLHMKLWTDYGSVFENTIPRSEDANMMQKNTEDKVKEEFYRREQWVRNFCENAPDEVKERLKNLDINVVLNYN